MSAQRPLSDDRYDCGRLRPPAPNAKVIEDRVKWLGSEDNLERAATPMGIALARGWITEAQHRTGVRLARLHRQAIVAGPRQGSGSLPEYSPGLAMKEPWSSVSDADIVEVFDSVFSVGPAQTSQADLALRQWRAACAALTAAENAQVFWTCIREDWPQWLKERLDGRMDTRYEASRDLLLSALDKAASALRKPRTAHREPVRWVDPGPKSRAPKLVSERVNYVNGEGSTVLEVVKVARR